MDGSKRNDSRGGRFPERRSGKSGSRFPGGGKAIGRQEKGWDGVAGWYDKLVGVDGSDYHQNVILPAVMELLNVKKDQEILDVCCGQGVLVKHLVAAGAGRILGVDASGKLIGSARQRYATEKKATFLKTDACVSGEWADGTFDSAACVMAVHDVPDINGLMANIADSLKPGGRAVIVMMHPCFRIPKESHWGWDGDQKIQYRRLDKYGKPLEIVLQTRPGLGTDESTTFYHRPLAELIGSMGRSGLGVTNCVELFSHRRSQLGPFSKAEHRAAEEFPLFIGLVAQKM